MIALAAENNILNAVDSIIPGGLANIFNFGLALGALIAFGTIIYAGILYSASGDNSSKQKDAREWIWAAIQGLGLLALGFIILRIINPNLVSIKPVVIGHLEPLNIEVSEQRPIGTPYTPTGTTTYYEVPLLKQAGYPWGCEEYGSGCKVADSSTSNCGGYGGTYSVSGCGPTATAMAVLYLTGNKFMDENTAVEEVGSSFSSAGGRPCGSGTDGSFMNAVVSKYGLKATDISGQSGIETCLGNKGVVVAGVSSPTEAEMADLSSADKREKPIFTTAGHFIVVKGIDLSRNIVFINDPGGRDVESSNIPHFLKYAASLRCVSK